MRNKMESLSFCVSFGKERVVLLKGHLAALADKPQEVIGERRVPRMFVSFSTKRKNITKG